MERDFAGVRISRGTYRRLAKACEHDPRFPSSYRALLQLISSGTQHALDEGRRFDEMALDALVFLAWCQRLEVQPSFDALRAYLILCRGGDLVLPGATATEPHSVDVPPASAPPADTNKLAADRRRARLPLLVPLLPVR